MTRTTVVLVFGLAAVLSAGGTQTPQQQPVFRAGSVFVNVDAYPRRDGKVIEDLTRSDFEIFEDGKPQAVEAFEFIRIAPNTPDAERRDPQTSSDGDRQAADPRNRVFVVYLDLFHTGLFGSHAARQPVITFLSRTLGPTDLFAVMTPELPVSALTFGRRTETLEAELAKYWTWGEAGQRVFPRNGAENRLLLCPNDGEALVSAHRDDVTASNLEALMTRLQNLRDERKNILLISEGWVPRRGARPGTSTSSRPSIPTIGVGPGGTIGTGASGNMSGSPDRAWCDAQAARLLQIDFEERFRYLLTQARRANVSFYPVDVGGLRTGQMPVGTYFPPGTTALQMVAAAEEFRQSERARVDTLQTLAVNTDGHAIVNTNDLTGAVRQVSDDLSAYYLLGYYSTNAAADGKFRQIEVKVQKPGVKVTARRGYLAPTAAMLKAAAAAAAKPVTGPTPVDIELGRLARLRTDARLYTAVAASATALDVVVELASREIEGGRWKNGGAVTVAVSSSPPGASPVTTEGRIEPGARGVRVKVALPAAATAGWRVRATVKGDGEVLDDDLEVTLPPASLIGEPTVFRAGASPRSPLRGVADFLFRRTERVHIEWPVTQAPDERTARLLSRRGDALAVPVTLTERTDGDQLTIAADLTLAPLADGEYVIELTAAKGGDKVQRLLAFRVIR